MQWFAPVVYRGTIHLTHPARADLRTSLHLAGGRTPKDVKDLGHALEAACEVGILAHFGIPLTSTETVELQKANQYYEA